MMIPGTSDGLRRVAAVVSAIKGVAVLAIVLVLVFLSAIAQSVLLITKSSLSDRLPHLFYRAFARLLGIRIDVTGDAAGSRPLLLVSNHTSWIDIIVINALMPASFIAKREVGEWPVIGLGARLMRTFFVERTRRTAARGEAREIARRMVGRLPLVLFAEGTSNDGNRVLPFRSALLGAAQMAASAEPKTGAWVQPMSVAYTGFNGIPMGRAQRPQVAWYGDMNLVPHLWGVVTGRPIDVSVNFGKPVSVTAETDRKVLAAELEQSVRDMLQGALHGRKGEETGGKQRGKPPVGAVQTA